MEIATAVILFLVSLSLLDYLRWQQIKNLREQQDILKDYLDSVRRLYESEFVNRRYGDDTLEKRIAKTESRLNAIGQVLAPPPTIADTSSAGTNCQVTISETC